LFSALCWRGNGRLPAWLRFLAAVLAGLTAVRASRKSQSGPARVLLLAAGMWVASAFIL
jgi:hypothetical protein